jgi:hypothetical protein
MHLHGHSLTVRTRILALVWRRHGLAGHLPLDLLAVPVALQLGNEVGAVRA